MKFNSGRFVIVCMSNWGIKKLKNSYKTGGLEAYRLIDRKKLRDIVPYSASHIYRLEKAGKFPSRIPLGPGRVAYPEAEIKEWIKCKTEGRDWKPASSAKGGGDV